MAGWETPWNDRDDDWQELARFAASPDAVPPEMRMQLRPDADLDDVAAALTHAVRPQWWYAAGQPWHPGEGQLVRCPSQIAETRAANCLDICALLVTALLEADSDRRWHPKLAVAESPDQRARHAFLVISGSPGADVVQRVRPPARLLGAGRAVLDPTALLRTSATENPRGSGRVTDADWFQSWDVVNLVDIRAAQAHGVPRLGKPQRVPAMYETLPQPRTDLDDWQTTASDAAVTVISGETGIGKTEAALHLGAGGIGWRLDATTVNTLIWSLAAREQVRSPALELSDTSAGMAATALRRLNDTDTPWTVIVDGADADAVSYRRWLPIPRTGQQRLIITTTRPAADWSWLTDRVVHPPKDAAIHVRPAGQILAAVTHDERASVVTLAHLPGLALQTIVDDPAWLTRLSEVGAVSATTTVMHARTRQALRSHAPDWNTLAGLIGKAGPQLAGYTDTDDLKTLTQTLTDGLGQDGALAAAGKYLALLGRQLPIGLAALANGVAVVPPDPASLEPYLAAVEVQARTASDHKQQQECIDIANAGRQAAVSLGMADTDAAVMRLGAIALVAKRALAKTPQEVAEVLDLFEQLYERRKQALAAGHPDIDKSLYNLPGTRLRLAKMQQEPERSASLDRALTEYQQVLQAREDRFGSMQVDDVACCHNGMGLIRYYQAAIAATAAADGQRGADLTRVDRIRLLTQAAEDVTKALTMREAARIDTTPPRGAKDSATLLVKITATLLVTSTQPTATGDDLYHPVTKLLTDATTEVQQRLFAAGPTAAPVSA